MKRFAVAIVVFVALVAVAIHVFPGLRSTPATDAAQEQAARETEYADEMASLAQALEASRLLANACFNEDKEPVPSPENIAALEAAVAEIDAALAGVGTPPFPEVEALHEDMLAYADVFRRGLLHLATGLHTGNAVELQRWVLCAGEANLMAGEMQARYNFTPEETTTN